MAIGLAALLWCGGAIRNAQGHEPLHPVHFTTTWIEYDSATRSVVITIEVYGEEFAFAVGEKTGRKINLDRIAAGKSAKGAAAVMDYVNGKFELKDGADRGVKLEWIKLVKHDDLFRLHLRGKTEAGLTGAKLRNLLLCETDEDQVNTVFTKHGGREIKVQFVDKDGFKAITESEGTSSAFPAPAASVPFWMAT